MPLIASDELGSSVRLQLCSSLWLLSRRRLVPTWTATPSHNGNVIAQALTTIASALTSNEGFGQRSGHGSTSPAATRPRSRVSFPPAPSSSRSSGAR